jgi:hypothetical protein
LLILVIRVGSQSKCLVGAGLYFHLGYPLAIVQVVLNSRDDPSKTILLP